MKITAFAPHLAGRMLPAMFDYLGIGRKERFPGDPYAHQAPWSAWFWMHTTECGEPNHVGSSRSWTIPAALRFDETPSPQVAGNDRPSVGSMGARQPAGAGPLGGQAELFAEVAA